MSYAVSTTARNGRVPAAPSRTASVLGLGHYLPAEAVPNEPIAERIGVDHEWIVKRTGIRARRRAAPEERLGDIAARAGREALVDAGAVGPIALDTDGALADAIVATHEDRLLRVEGHETFQTAVERLSGSTLIALARAGLELDDVDLFVYHQANGRILRAVAERLELPPGKVADYIGEVGNTSAASIPLTLGLLREDGRLHVGQTILVAAIGAGFTLGRGNHRVGDHVTQQPKGANMPTTTITAEAVEKTLTEALPQFDVDPSEISRDATFEELDVDSLDLAEITQIIEDEYGVELKAEDRKNIKTVGDAIDAVVRQAG